MAFKGNPFALLKDDDDDDRDVSSLLSPVSNASESKMSAKPQFVGYERGRDSGFGRNSGTNVERLGRSQQNGMQRNQERVNNHRPSNDYRRYNGYSDGYRQHRGRANGHQQQSRRNNGYRKNDVPEQNNATDGAKPNIRDSGTEKGHWHTVGGGSRGRRFDENNGFTKGKVITGDSKEGEENQDGQEVPTGNNSEEGIKEKKKDIRMTLKEYEKQLLEKRKGLEALKLDERKVTLDKDLESMQLVGKKKEDFSLIKQHSEKEKLKKDVNLGKDDKLQKDCNAIMHAWYRGCRVQGGRYRGFSRAATTRREGETPEIAHSNKIPVQTPHVENLH